ncbi:unnamed protein product [Parajaminaea phylloscopi]
MTSVGRGDDVSASKSTLLHRGKPPWRRILYEQQPYPDSYLPESERSQPVIAHSIDPDRSLPRAWLGFALIISPLVQNINAVFIFLEVFGRLETGRLRPAQIIVWSFLAFICMAIASQCCQTVVKSREEARTRGRKPSTRGQRTFFSPAMIISCAIVLLLLFALSPMLRTLTEATTSDTIYPLAFALFTLHVCLADNTLTPLNNAPAKLQPSEHTSPQGDRHDLPDEPLPGTIRQPQGQLFSALSLNAAASASLVLASRLPSNAHVFVLLLTAMIVFALFPVLTNTAGARIRLTLSLCSAVVAITLALSLSSLGPLCFICVVNAFVVGLIPIWLHFAGYHKVRYVSMRVSGAHRMKVPCEPLWRVADPDAGPVRRHNH